MLGRLIRMLTRDTLKGYEHPDVIDVVFRKTLAYNPTIDWPEIAGATSVLDFGGGCGRHYKEAKHTIPHVRWAIVETPAMVGRAKELETDRLRFFTTIPAAADWLGRSIDVVHSNGAIQFAAHPPATIATLCEVRAKKLLWYRINFGGTPDKATSISRLTDHGPDRMRGVRNANVKIEYSRITEADFLAAHSAYDLEARGDDWFRFCLR